MARVDKILKCPVEELEKMTDSQIEEYFSSSLNITRPQPKEKTSTVLTRADAAPMKIKSPEKQAKEDRARAISEKWGIDLKDLM